MLKIGITGCIGSGKSTVAQIFAVLGVPVYYADKAAKHVMLTDGLLKSQITKLFGNDSYFSDGQLNRAHLSSIVFSNPEKLAALNAVVHPAVFKDFDNWCDTQTSPYIIKEAALMFESNSYKHLDKVIMVTAPEALRIQRTIQRDHISEEAVKARMNNQFTEDVKLSRSHFEIKNDEMHLIIPQVLALHQEFLVG